MNSRRAFFSSLLGAAVASCVRWLPMPEKPKTISKAEQVQAYVNWQLAQMEHYRRHLDMIVNPMLIVDGDVHVPEVYVVDNEHDRHLKALLEFHNAFHPFLP